MSPQMKDEGRNQTAGLDPRGTPISDEGANPLPPTLDTRRVIKGPAPTGEDEKRRETADLDPREIHSGEGADPSSSALDTRRERRSAPQTADLAPLFAQEAATAFRMRWDSVQRGFVDDPRQAVHGADEMVKEIIQSLAARFAEQRATLEGNFEKSQGPSTENLRLALQQYRSFFERLLSL